MRRLIALLFVVLTLVSCAGTKMPSLSYPQYERNAQADSATYEQEIIPVYIDEAFKDDERADVKSAVAEWNFAFNGYVTYPVVNDHWVFSASSIEDIQERGGLVFVAVKADELLFVPSGVLAWVDELGDNVVHMAVDRLRLRNFKKVAMHEMGHTLGIAHTLASGTLMSSYYQDQSTCIDRYTLQTLTGTRYARAVHWDWHHMNYCHRP